MEIWKNLVLFYLGGGGYMILEFLWRGRSHYTMFLLGGCCFLLLGKLRRLHLSLPRKSLIGALCITTLEYFTGLIVNRHYGIWDYRRMPMNFNGQICLPYFFLWIPVSIGGMALYGKILPVLQKKIHRRK